MKVTYDPEGDGLRILFSDAPIERSSDEVPGLILDYDNNGSVVGLELTHASQRMPNPREVEFIERPSLIDIIEQEEPLSKRSSREPP